MFSLDALKTELRRAQHLQKQLATLTVSEMEPSELGLDDFITAFQGDTSSPSCAHAVAHMWPKYHRLVATQHLVDLHLNTHRRRIMLCSAAAWYWLTQSCAQRCHVIATRLQSDLTAYTNSDDWLERFCSAVYTDVQKRKIGRYRADTFLPGIYGTPSPGYLPRPRQLEEDIRSRVCDHVIRILRDWLGYPNNTEMLAAYWVMYVVGAFKNTDVLLLQGVWQTHRSIKASILGHRGKASSIRISMLDPFAQAIKALPLADPQSEECRTLQQFSTAVETCLPGVKDWTELLVRTMINGKELVNYEPHSLPLQTPPTSAARHPPISTSAASTTIISQQAPPSQFVSDIPPPSAPLMLAVEKGLQSLANFVLHVLPIALGQDLPQPSHLQSIIIARPDHYLPFRELATCRTRVSGPGGPYHSTRRDQQGAFPSWLIFRALLFDSEVMRERTLCYFQRHEDWLSFLAAEGYNPSDRASENRFFNVSCYGSAQNQRRANALDYAKRYFAGESRWAELVVAHRGEPVPFLDFYFWTQATRQVRIDPDGTRHFTSIPNNDFPLVGKLTGYLLTADLVYAGKVQRPSAEDVAYVILRNGLGSVRGLHTAGQISSTKCALQEVGSAFKRVYAYLEKIIPQQHHSHICFDEIMVEHLLCKYQRTKHINITAL